MFAGVERSDIEYQVLPTLVSRHTAHYQFLLQTIDLLTAPPPSPCLAILHSGGSAGDNITLSFTSAALTSLPLFTTNIEIARYFSLK